MRLARFVLLGSCVAFAACGGGQDTAGDTGAVPDSGAAVAQGGADGAALYARCVTCHQQNGEGVPGAFPPLTNSEWVTSNPEVPIRIVLHGLQGPINVNGTEYNGVMMPYGGTGGVMNDEEVAALLTYIRSSFGNNATAITADQVAQVRAATSSQSGPYTAADLEPLLKGG